MENIKVGMEFEQTTEIRGFPYNRINELWKVREVEEGNILLGGVPANLTLGVTEEELNKYFKSIAGNTVQQIVYFEKGEKEKVIRNGRATIVILSDGSKGVSKCLPQDTYDAVKGYDIAYIKAKIKSLKKQLKQLSW
ncbi:hypothetical protein C4A75_00205 [Brevibacillus laterosporus]|uniref:hypothetical protein n=1 Tax=Brevibacillus laterosporus TaxID=1465 RepID=UPI000CE37603|nr:hypothetical protein [Brevibacillus laterosporus]PPA87677.1 hypothetical protein C4A75_00205 [Brevibacillus laterosporus]